MRLSDPDPDPPEPEDAGALSLALAGRTAAGAGPLDLAGCTCPRCLRRMLRPAGPDPTTGRAWLCFHCLFPDGRILVTADGRIKAPDS